MSWLVTSPYESLPLVLADNEFYVWISNARGTRFSLRHLTLDPAKPEYWDWTWDELVVHDLSSVADFVFNQTAQKIHCVGHSLGTLVPLAAFSEGKLSDRIKSAALLSPIAYLSHMTTALGVVAAKPFVGEAASIFGLSEFNPKGSVKFYIFLEHYGAPEPPIYDSSKITREIPLLLSYGGSVIGCQYDVEDLLDTLKLDKLLQVQYVKYYAHVDFLLGVTAEDLIYIRNQ